MTIRIQTRCSTVNSGGMFRKMRKAHAKLIQMEEKKRVHVKTCLNDLTKHTKEDMKELEGIFKEIQTDSSITEVEFVDDDYFKTL